MQDYSRTLPVKELEITFLDAFSSTCKTDGMRALKALPFLSVVVCERGRYTVSLDGRPAFQVRAGQAFIAPAEVLQDITHHLDDQGAMSMCWLFIEVRLNRLYRFGDLYEFPPLLSRKQADPFKRMIRRLEQPAPSYPDLARQKRVAYEAAEALMRLGTPKRPPVPEVQPAVAYIREHYPEPFSMERLAQLCSLSSWTFLSRFKKATGQTPSAYLLQTRLSAALTLVQYSEQSMAHIAEVTGFYDQFYFSRCFKAAYGMAPLPYRKAAGETIGTGGVPHGLLMKPAPKSP